MTNSVERPIVHVLGEEQPSEPDALRLLEPQTCAESAKSDERLLNLWSYITERSTLSQLQWYAFRYTHNLKDAEDCVSDAIVRTATCIRNLEHRSRPVIIKYLHTTIKNLAFDLTRQLKNARKLRMLEGGLKAPNENDFHRCSTPDLHDSARFDVEDRRVWVTFMAIPQASRRVALLRFLLEYDVETIADKLHIKRATVYKHIELARKAFQRDFPREGGTYESK